MEFLSLSCRCFSVRNIPSGEDRGETDVFTGYVNSGTALYGGGEGGKIYFPLFKLAKCQRRPLGKVSELVLLPVTGNCTVHNVAVNFPMNYTTCMTL